MLWRTFSIGKECRRVTLTGVSIFPVISSELEDDGAVGYLFFPDAESDARR